MCKVKSPHWHHVQWDLLCCLMFFVRDIHNVGGWGGGAGAKHHLRAAHFSFLLSELVG